MIELEQTKSGLITIKYNGRYIHSKYDPICESNQFIRGNMELINKPTIVVYGIGLGYHIDAIARKMNHNSMLYVFEWNKELIKCCRENNKNIFNNKNIKIFENDNKFYTNLSKYLSKAGDIIIHKPSLDTIRSSNEVLYNLINDYSFSKQSLEINKETVKNEEENYEANKKLKYGSIKCVVNKLKDSNKPYIIVCSGPSLDGELDRLRENREKFNIIAVGSSLRALMNKKIKPDVIVIVDGSEAVRKQFIGYEKEEIPLCFLSRASRWAVNAYKGPKYMFNGNDEDEITLRTGGTVAIPAMDIAVKCGTKKVILLGQDLAFIREKSHIGDFEEIYGIKDDLKKNYLNKFVEGVDGKFVNTTEGYIRFKNKIELLISNYKNVQFINCSKGVYIKGAKHLEFEELLKTL
ncbi:motility associated factor glycosyltransferase family protein [Clostridium beijerinckii]|jgi:Uncharacterized protein conserved in bacteria|uniref:6-hydroxymethylpterin diphosphokinase MptE-like domain-containing protein n=1 Tax=Clostridium beijerinckii (strain ATCC 51743 / NCIMB 8052) TaxID=290402 RepID=A6M1A6_CLOB8|nr:6-hydroxymethylpterin diphosphokinase MptE-like protein [Clostridium beijerinckii]ABR36386.1 protein of unknown function DUF115 [Clostridium beijerinckii NCIMB 8052]AIU03212.1 hypothetical protein Cbs_4276 [Clostridium beijerinckii ATCC 35702]NRT22550.1 hypothetical protein [Clostridium beijerinckii]NRT64934.1 hypothetical protein [Clostridium beijerinckii]NRT83543.1 hypothetical protein [Clostridium beijerinckii]